ncbi:hypothetical protein V8C42DRAFT_309201 [Trichoderma barbatum]
MDQAGFERPPAVALFDGSFSGGLFFCLFVVSRHPIHEVRSTVISDWIGCGILRLGGVFVWATEVRIPSYDMEY